MEDTRHVGATLSKNGEKAEERIRETADTAMEKGRATLKELSHQGKEAMARAQKGAKETWDDAQKLLHKHPGKAVGLALLVGAAIGGAIMAMRKARSSRSS